MAEPEYRVQGTDLPKGSATQLDEAMDVAAAAPAAPTFDSSQVDQSEIPEVVGEVAPDETDDEIFAAPTMFPNRPLTHGVPMGPGQNFAVTPRMTDRAILNEAAKRILELRDDIPSGASIFAGRVLAGE